MLLATIQIENDSFLFEQAVFYTGDVGVKDLYDDGISPWQTGAWGYWDANKTMLNMTQTEIWKQDTIGLKKLDDAGRLHVQSVKNIRHNDWIRNESIIKQYVLPWLVSTSSFLISCLRKVEFLVFMILMQ